MSASERTRAALLATLAATGSLVGCGVTRSEEDLELARPPNEVVLENPDEKDGPPRPPIPSRRPVTQAAGTRALPTQPGDPAPGVPVLSPGQSPNSFGTHGVPLRLGK
jgi:hypothetical protein